MLKDADPKSFTGICLVSGYTGLRYGIDSIVAIIIEKYKLSVFDLNIFYSEAKALTKSKDWSVKETNFSFSPNMWNPDISAERGIRKKPEL